MDQFQFSSFSASDLMNCVVDGTEIVQVDYMHNRRVIGKTLAAYEELEGTTTQYYEKLVELGVIVPEKTPEQMMSEMQGTMLEMSKIIASLSSEIKELKEHGHEQCACRSGQDVSQREPQRSSRKGTGSDQRDAGQP